LESNVSLFVRALAIKNRANAFFGQVARIPNLASRQYRPSIGLGITAATLITSKRACIAMEPTGAKGLARLCIALIPRNMASPAARTVGQSNTVRTGLFDTVNHPASRVLELEFQHLSNIRLLSSGWWLARVLKSNHCIYMYYSRYIAFAQCCMDLWLAVILNCCSLSLFCIIYILMVGVVSKILATR
jgi:hypothetical protein